MKRFVTLCLALVLALSLAACGSGNGSGSGEVDMSAYPADINEWTAQNFIDYFTAAGACTGDVGFETWIQDHANYWPETPVSECAGWWDELGTSVMICTLSPDLADSSQEQYDAWMTSIREEKLLTEEEGWMPIEINHLMGNVAFSFEILDEELEQKVEQACQDLAQALGVTPDF